LASWWRNLRRFPIGIGIDRNLRRYLLAFWWKNLRRSLFGIGIGIGITIGIGIGIGIGIKKRMHVHTCIIQALSNGLPAGVHTP